MEKKEFREEFSQFMKQTGKSQKQVSKETGLSTSVISQFLDGKYTGDNGKVQDILNKFLSISKDRLNSVSGTTYYPDLYNTKEVLYACWYAHKYNDIALVAGDAGAGKTTALEHYRDSNAGVTMVTVNTCTTSATDGRRSAVMQELISQLSGSNRLIIIDEADRLSLQALQAIRDLNDQAHVGIILSGNDKIYKQMLTGQKGREFDQIRTRIIVRKRVENNYTVEEMQHIFPGVPESCLAFLIQMANLESLRTAIKLYEIALEYARISKEAVTLKMLKDTQKQLFGRMY